MAGTLEGIYPKLEGDVNFASEGNSGVGIVTATSGEALTAGNAVFINETDGEVYKSNTTTAADEYFDGFVIASVADDTTCHVQTSGIYPGLSSLTAGETYYLTAAAGALSTTAGSIIVGTAVSTTALTILKNFGTRMYVNRLEDRMRETIGFRLMSPYGASQTTETSGSGTVANENDAFGLDYELQARTFTQVNVVDAGAGQFTNSKYDLGAIITLKAVSLSMLLNFNGATGSIEYSDNDSDWTTIASETVLSNYEEGTYAVDDTARWIRFRLLSSSGNTGNLQVFSCHLIGY